MKIRETSYFPSWIGRQTKLKPTNRAHILDIFNTYYGNRVKSDSIVVHRGSFKAPAIYTYFYEGDILHILNITLKGEVSVERGKCLCLCHTVAPIRIENGNINATDLPKCLENLELWET